MKKYLWLILIVFGFNLNYKTIADEVEQKTDGSFVGDNTDKPMNTSFIGNTSNSIVDESNASTNGYFAGDYSDKEEQTETDAPFAGDNSFVEKN